MKPSTTPLRFGAFELDPRALELWRSGRRVRIAPQPAKALVFLVSRSGSLVTKDELAAHLWGRDTHVDAEAGLHAVVKQIRQALGDSSKGPRYLETLPRLGYRFVAPVERQPADVAAHRRRRRWLAAAVAAVVVAAFGALAAWWRQDALPPPAASPAAVDAYFKGQYILAQGASDAGSRAFGMFERALQLDPRSAPALIGRAESRLRMTFEGNLSRRAALEHVRATAAEALVIAPRNGRAMILRARARWLLDWDWEGAERDFDQAVELASDNADLRRQRAHFLSASGRHAEALEEAERARRLAPTSPSENLDIAWLHFFAQRYEEAVAEGLRALELSPGFFGAHFCLAEAYKALGRDSESRTHATAMTVAGSAGDGALADLHELDGETVSQRIEDWWTDESRTVGFRLPDYERAIIELGNGYPEAALRALERSVEMCESGVEMVAVDPRLTPLHGMAAFQALLSKINRGEQRQSKLGTEPAEARADLGSGRG